MNLRVGYFCGRFKFIRYLTIRSDACELLFRKESGALTHIKRRTKWALRCVWINII